MHLGNIINHICIITNIVYISNIFTIHHYIVIILLFTCILSIKKGGLILATLYFYINIYNINDIIHTKMPNIINI